MIESSDEKELRIDWEIYLFGLLVATAICEDRRGSFAALKQNICARRIRVS